MSYLRNMFEYITDYFLEPSLQWILAHPIATVLVLSLLVWWVGQTYKTKIK